MLWQKHKISKQKGVLFPGVASNLAHCNFCSYSTVQSKSHKTKQYFYWKELHSYLGMGMDMGRSEEQETFP